MGVKGLFTYLKENRHKFSYTLELKSKDNDVKDAAMEDAHVVHLVVDGWSFLYAVYKYAGEPWVYGGEYAALAKHVENTVLAWRRVGIRPNVVFDGPTPPIKYPTSISRRQDNCVKQANLFFRTSATARSTASFLAETRIGLPLGYVAILSTLLSMGDDVTVHIAEGEADSYAVELAGKLGAYVAGNDTDFIVMNSEGYKGYIPLDDMVWYTSFAGELSPDSSSFVDEDGSEFQVVTKKKQKGKPKVKESGIVVGNGPILPSSQGLSTLSLSMTVYEPAALATHVSLPLALLPLLGAFIGNDYASHGFFRSSESAVARVQRAADTLSSVLKEAQSANSKKIRRINRDGEGSVMDIIGTTVERLLLWRNPRDSPTSGQIDQISEAIVKSTLEYAMSSPTPLFLYDEEATHDTNSHHTKLGAISEQVRNLYLRAYHRGILHPRIMETFARGVCFPSHFLEDPDRECCPRSIGRPVREVIWRVCVSGGGIPIKPDPMTDVAPQSDNEASEDEDELVDVVEEPSDDDVPEDEEEEEEDPLAALRGRLQRLSFSGLEVPDVSEAPDIPETNDLSRPDTVTHTPTNISEMSQAAPRTKVVTEYVRRGTRIVPEDIELSGSDDLPWDATENLTPIQLRPVPERLNAFLKALGSDTPSVRAIAAEAGQNNSMNSVGSMLLPVVVLRWILQTLHNRAEDLEDDNRKRDRDKEKWTRAEAEAFLSCLSEVEDRADLPPIENRAIQLTAQVLSAFEAIAWLAQALLLVSVSIDSKGDQGVRLPVVFGETEKAFSGQRFHQALAYRRKGSGTLFQQLWNASTEGLANVFGDEKGKKKKKERKTRNEHNQQISRPRKPAGSIFSALADIDG